MSESSAKIRCSYPDRQWNVEVNILIIEICPLIFFQDTEELQRENDYLKQQVEMLSAEPEVKERSFYAFLACRYSRVRKSRRSGVEIITRVLQY